MQGSFDRAALNRQIEHMSNAVSTAEKIRGLVVEILATRAYPASFSNDDTLAEIGIASLDMVRLLLAVESEFNVEVPQHEITPEVFRSVSTIDALVWRLLPPSAPGAAWQVGSPDVASFVENASG